MNARRRPLLNRDLRWRHDSCASSSADIVNRTFARAENDDSYVLRADLPGMKKEDVNVELDGQIVRITATKKDTKKWEDEGYKYHRAERRDTMEYSQRALRMPANTDFNKLEAGFDDGTLTVTFGKQKTTTPTSKQIKIQ